MEIYIKFACALFQVSCLIVTVCYKVLYFMMTSSNRSIFRVTGHLCGEFTGPRWIPRTKASDAELWWFFLICVWINGWVKIREAGDLRRYRAHDDVTVTLDKTLWAAMELDKHELDIFTIDVILLY